MRRLKKLWLVPALLLIAIVAFAAWDVPGPVNAFQLIAKQGGGGEEPSVTGSSDNFNRANSDTLGNLSGGTYAWSEVVTDMDIESNAVHNVDGGIAVLNPAVDISDVAVLQALMNSEGSGYSRPALIFWYEDTDNYWFAELSLANPDDEVRLGYWAEGEQYWVEDGGGILFGTSTDHTLKVVISGTNIKVYSDLGGETPDIDYNAASAGSGNVGIKILRSSATGYIDDFVFTP